jgi:hypothetical protein
VGDFLPVAEVKLLSVGQTVDLTITGRGVLDLVFGPDADNERNGLSLK